MKHLTITISLFFLIACGQRESKKETSELTTLQNDSLGYVPVDEDSINKKENTEYLDWSLLNINGKLPLVCKQIDLYELLGQPDSIVNPDFNNICVSYYEKDFKYAYYGEGNFEIHGDSAAISIIDFNKIELVYNDQELVLNNSVTIESLNRLFPIAITDKEEVNLPEIGKAICIRIPTSKKVTNDAWLLFFVNGKLIRLDYWMPC